MKTLVLSSFGFFSTCLVYLFSFCGALVVAQSDINMISDKENTHEKRTEIKIKHLRSSSMSKQVKLDKQTNNAVIKKLSEQEIREIKDRAITLANSLSQLDLENHSPEPQR